MTRESKGLTGLFDIGWYRLVGVLILAGLLFMVLSCQSSPTVEVGSPAPDVTVTTLDGKQAKLSDFRGKTVVLNFWATWCGPCRNEIPVIEAVHQEYAEKGIVIVAVNLKEDHDTVEAFVDWADITFPVFLDSEGAAAKTYRVRAVPTTYFVDAEGVIRGARMGGMNEDMLLDGIDSALGPA